MKRSQIKAGMVFGLGLPDGRLALIQLIKKDAPIFYMVAFKHLLSAASDFTPSELSSAVPLFLGNFFDNMITTDQWVFLGTAPISDVPFPLTRILVNGTWHIEDWERKKVAEMNLEDAQRFPLRSDHSGVVMQRAILHHFSFLEVDERMRKLSNELCADYVSSVSKL